MIKESLIEIFERDLKKLIVEINLYKDENNLWITMEGTSNSAGNLCLHLVGNLNHFIGATLGNTGYIRHRDDEFVLKNIPRQDLIINIENCMLIVKNTVNELPMEDFEKVKNVPDFTIIGHITAASSGVNLVAKAGTSHPITAQGWNAFK